MADDQHLLLSKILAPVELTQGKLTMSQEEF